MCVDMTALPHCFLEVRVFFQRPSGKEEGVEFIRFALRSTSVKCFIPIGKTFYILLEAVISFVCDCVSLVNDLIKGLNSKI